MRVLLRFFFFSPSAAGLAGPFFAVGGFLAAEAGALPPELAGACNGAAGQNQVGSKLQIDRRRVQTLDAGFFSAAADFGGAIVKDGSIEVLGKVEEV